MTFGVLKRLLDRSSKPADTPSVIAREFLASVELISSDKSAKTVGDICENISDIWNYLFDIDRVLAAQRKFELAEELLLRPDIIKWLLLTFRFVEFELQKKIRDLVFFILTWCSNDSEESSIPRRKAKSSKHNVKTKDALYHSKDMIHELVVTGYDEPSSIGVYNDIIRVFVEDDLCLEYILKDTSKKHKRRGCCFWFIFERLTGSKSADHSTQDQYDLIHSSLETLEMFLNANNRVMNKFLTENWDRFAIETAKLMSSQMFLIKLKSMKMMFSLLTSGYYSNLRKLWTSDPGNVKIIVNNMLNEKKEIRLAALDLFEIFLYNPRNNPKVDDFISTNCNRLIKYFIDFSPVHMYSGTLEELEDARYARNIHKLFQWNLVRPLNREDMEEFEKSEEYQQKLFEEQTVVTRPPYEDDFSGPISYHLYNISVPCHLPILKEVTTFKIADQKY